MLSMDIKTARIICDLLELRNFSKVAKKHKVSQSAISQKLAQIEMANKCQIFNRKHRPFIPTKAGELFYKACKDILERYEKLNTDINTLAKFPSQFNIDTILSIGMYTLQPYIKIFMARYPKVKLNIEYYEANQIYNRILSGDSDIGIVAVPQKKRNINVYTFKDEPLVLACSIEHSLANEAAVDIHKLQDKDFIAFNKNIPTRKLTDSILKQYNVCVNIKKEFDNIETIKRAVEINAGISILPQTAMIQELANGTLKAIPFSNERFVRPTGMLIKKTEKLNPLAQYYLEILLNGKEHEMST
jgi:DNA-binding transcriptional LysR family regulator